MRRRTPSAVIAVAGVAVALVVVPTVTFVSRLPWSELAEILTSDAITVPLRVSVVTSVLAALWAIVLGAALGVVMATTSTRRAGMLRGILTVPVVLPPVVAGLVLLVAFGPDAPIGRLLGAVGVSLPFSTGGVVLAQVFVAFPFVAIAVERSVAASGWAPEEAAAVAGVGSGGRFLRVTLPSIRGALMSGGLFAWARAFGEFGATLTFAGSFPGRTETLPQGVYLAVATDREVAVVGGSLMMVVAFVVAFAGFGSLRRVGPLRPVLPGRDPHTS